MDEELLALCAFMALFISFPISVALITTGCVAYSRAKKWDRQRNLKVVHAETDRLVDSASEDDSDFFDSDDEEEHHARKAEEASDKLLTFNQKWRKEFRKVWNGKGAQELMKAREREERKKLAKAVAKELDRRDRRRARKAQRDGQADEQLPVYRKE
jgi:hypothetical protein